MGYCNDFVSVVIIVCYHLLLWSYWPIWKDTFTGMFLWWISAEFRFWSQFKIQYGCKSQWCNLIGWTFKLCCSIITKVNWNLIVVNDPGVLLYKVCYFSTDRKSKMAATARMVIWLFLTKVAILMWIENQRWVLGVNFNNILVILWDYSSIGGKQSTQRKLLTCQ